MNKRMIKKKRDQFYKAVIAAKIELAEILTQMDGWELLDFVRETKKGDLHTFQDHVLMHVICAGSFQDDLYHSFNMPATRDVIAMGVTKKGRLHLLTTPYVYGEEAEAV